MTKQKSFKSRVRARMDKTSESYTAARRQLLAKSTPDPEARPTRPPGRAGGPGAPSRWWMLLGRGGRTRTR